MDKIKAVAQRLGIITVEDMERYTALQLIMMIANKMNELQEIINVQNDKIDDLFDGVLSEIEQILNEWIKDGTLDTLINQSALKEINERVDETNVQLSHIANVYLKDYGAVCDYTTDDSQAFQRIMDEVNRTKIVIVLPAGSGTVIDQTVTVKDGKQIYIVGNNCSIKTTTGKPLFTSANLSFIHFENVGVSGFSNGTAKHITSGNCKFGITTYNVGWERFINPINSEQYGVELENYSGQDVSGATNKKAMVIHNYNDGGVVQFDNVGSGTNVYLSNARNTNRREKQGSNFKGTGSHLICHDVDLGAVFEVRNTGSLRWNVGQTYLTNTKEDDGVWAFTMSTSNQHANVFNVSNGGNRIFEVFNEGIRAESLRLKPTTSDRLKYNSFFVDSKDGNKLKYMDSKGVVKTVNLTE